MLPDLDYEYEASTHLACSTELDTAEIWISRTHVELYCRSRLLSGREPRASKQGVGSTEGVGGGIGGSKESTAAGARPKA